MIASAAQIAARHGIKSWKDELGPFLETVQGIKLIKSYNEIDFAASKLETRSEPYKRYLCRKRPKRRGIISSSKLASRFILEDHGWTLGDGLPAREASK